MSKFLTAGEMKVLVQEVDNILLQHDTITKLPTDNPSALDLAYQASHPPNMPSHSAIFTETFSTTQPMFSLAKFLAPSTRKSSFDQLEQLVTTLDSRTELARSFYDRANEVFNMHGFEELSDEKRDFSDVEQLKFKIVSIKIILKQLRQIFANNN